MWNPFHHDEHKDDQQVEGQPADQTQDVAMPGDSSLETPVSTDETVSDTPVDSSPSEVDAAVSTPSESVEAGQGTVDPEAAVTETPAEQPVPGVEVTPEEEWDSSTEEQQQ